MIRLRRLAMRLLSVARRQRLDVELDEEINSHLDLAIDAHRARGLSPEEARRAALREFGGVTVAREAYREVRGFPAISAVWRDTRYAIRSFRRAPAFSAVAVLSLTLAIGANTSIFSLLNALVLRELPVRDPETLVRLATVSKTGTEQGLSYALFQDVARRQQVFSSVVGWWGASIEHIDVDGAPTSAAVFAATGNLYSELGVQPSTGRLLSSADMDMAEPSATQVAVLGHDFWQRAFLGHAAAIGRTIKIANVPFTVIGVAPQGFTAFGLVIQPDVTIPLPAVQLINGRPVAAMRTRPSLWIQTIGRLKPNVTLDQAQAQLMSIWPDVQHEAMPATYGPAERADFQALRLSLTSAANGIELRLRSRFTRPLIVVMTVALLVLLIACVNLASLMLSRAAARSHEMALRLALGAGRWRIAQQGLTEGLVLAAAAIPGGVLFAWWSCAVVKAAIFRDFTVPAALDVSPDGRVLLFAVALAVGAALLFSALPIWRLVRTSSGATLKGHTRSVTTTSRSGRVLVAIQVGLSFVLITHAGLLVRTLDEIRSVSPGFTGEGVVVAYPSLRPGAAAGLDNDTYYPNVINQLAALPGVTSAAASQLKPAGGGGWEGRVAGVSAPAAAADGPISMFTPVTPGFFDTLGVSRVAGRDFAWTDHSRARRVTVLSAALAGRLFPGGGAIGQRVRVGADPRRQDLEVVGIVADTRLYNLKSDNVFALYVPSLQEPDGVDAKCFLLRGSGLSLASIKGVVESFGYESLGTMQSVQEITDQALLQERLTATLAGFFALLALLLAAVGLYGVLAYAVSRREREFGIRRALGAGGGRVMTEVVQQGMAVTLTGIGLGLAAALFTAPLLTSLLFGLAPHDPLTFGLTAAALAGVALVACVVPAARAARVDPMIALRAE